jgi:hypothetical protein
MPPKHRSSRPAKPTPKMVDWQANVGLDDDGDSLGVAFQSLPGAVAATEIPALESAAGVWELGGLTEPPAPRGARCFGNWSRDAVATVLGKQLFTTRHAGGAFQLRDEDRDTLVVFYPEAKCSPGCLSSSSTLLVYLVLRRNRIITNSLR